MPLSALLLCWDPLIDILFYQTSFSSNNTAVKAFYCTFRSVSNESWQCKFVQKLSMVLFGKDISGACILFKFLIFNYRPPIDFTIFYTRFIVDFYVSYSLRSIPME